MRSNPLSFIIYDVFFFREASKILLRCTVYIRRIFLPLLRLMVADRYRIVFSLSTFLVQKSESKIENFDEPNAKEKQTNRLMSMTMSACFLHFFCQKKTNAIITIFRIFSVLLSYFETLANHHYRFYYGCNEIAVQLFIDIIRNKIAINSMSNFHEFYVCLKNREQ